MFIGPGDLAAALGHVGNPKHPEVQAAIEDAIARIRACGKPAGILSADEALARRYIELGCSFVAVGSDLGIPRPHLRTARRKVQDERLTLRPCPKDRCASAIFPIFPRTHAVPSAPCRKTRRPR
nr:aldolase/citrate lyase family protein [Azospirillum sp. INR13]